MVLFGALEWLAPSFNGTAPAADLLPLWHTRTDVVGGGRLYGWRRPREEGASSPNPPLASIPVSLYEVATDHDTTNHKKNLNSNYHLAKSEYS
uniref:Uncharacterized protein n=1 Tax=Oryza sativa subsp. japonica TaxID=39947 RepID=Q6ZL85_ORYSJ|nr:hypothetical protein [Oryza sativa Japonica Group]